MSEPDFRAKNTFNFQHIQFPTLPFTSMASSQMACPDVYYAQRVIRLLENREVPTETLRDPVKFAEEVTNLVNHSWKEHSTTVLAVAERLRLVEGFNESETLAGLREIRQNPGDLDGPEIPLDYDALHSAYHVTFCLPPMNGLNILYAMNVLENVITANPSVSVVVPNETIPSKIDTQELLSKLVTDLNLGVEVPQTPPDNSRDMHGLFEKSLNTVTL